MTGTALQQTLGSAGYEGVFFPVVAVGDEEGHDSVAHVAYRVPGADVEWTGRKAVKGTLKIALINGFGRWPNDLFPRLHDQLVALFRSRPQGTLAHPYYGEMRVQIDSWKRDLDPKIQNGVYLDLAFTETNASAFLPAVTEAAAEPASAMERAASGADALLPATAPATAPVVAEQLAYLESEDRSTSEAYAALGVIQQVALDAAADPALEGVEGHEARAELRALNASSWAYARAYVNGRQQRTYQVPAECSLAEVATAVYGDPALTDLLRGANRVLDECFVPAGTVLMVPDASA